MIIIFLIPLVLLFIHLVSRTTFTRCPICSTELKRKAKVCPGCHNRRRPLTDAEFTQLVAQHDAPRL